MLRNPQAKNYAVLGLSAGQWTAAKAALTTYLTTNESLDQVDEATLRAQLPAPLTDKAWNELKRELGIS